jgi:hypothetical protein
VDEVEKIGNDAESQNFFGDVFEWSERILSDVWGVLNKKMNLIKPLRQNI